MSTRAFPPRGCVLVRRFANKRGEPFITKAGKPYSRAVIARSVDLNDEDKENIIIPATQTQDLAPSPSRPLSKLKEYPEGGSILAAVLPSLISSVVSRLFGRGAIPVKPLRFTTESRTAFREALKTANMRALIKRIARRFNLKAEISKSKLSAFIRSIKTDILAQSKKGKGMIVGPFGRSPDGGLVVGPYGRGGSEN